MAHDIELIGFRLDDVSRRFDLAAQRGLLDGRRHHIGGQGQIGRFEFEALIIGERTGRLDLPTLAAEYVGCIRDIHRRLKQIENRRRAGRSEFGGRELLALGGRVGVYRRQKLAGLGVEVFLGLPQRGLGGLQARIGDERFGDQAVEFLGAEDHPPFARNVAADIEFLRHAARDIGRRRRCRLGFRRDAGDGWIRRRRKIGADRAGGQGQQRQPQERQGCGDARRVGDVEARGIAPVHARSRLVVPPKLPATKHLDTLERANLVIY